MNLHKHAVDLNALSERLGALLRPFGISVTQFREESRDRVWATYLEMVIADQPPFEKRRIGRKISIPQEELYFNEDKRYWDEWPLRTADSFLSEALQTIAEPLPTAPGVDWRPNEQIPEDHYA